MAADLAQAQNEVPYANVREAEQEDHRIFQPLADNPQRRPKNRRSLPAYNLHAEGTV